MVQKGLKFILLFATLLLFDTNCSGDKTPLSAERGEISIHFLSDANISYSDIAKKNINNLLIKEAVCTAQDIESYTILYSDGNPFKSHVIKFKDEMYEKFGDHLLPFVFIANGTRIYKGEYWPAFTSNLPQGNMLIRFSKERYDIMPYSEKGNDEINDPRILAALSQAGVTIEYRNISRK